MSTTEHLQLLQKERMTEDEKKNLDNYKQKFEEWSESDFGRSWLAGNRKRPADAKTESKTMVSEVKKPFER